MPRKVSHPRRVRARKDKNYRAVHRPTRWGNPYPVDVYGRAKSVMLYRGWLRRKLKENPGFLEPLRGYRLGCFCPEAVPCHADVILEFLYGTPEPESADRRRPSPRRKTADRPGGRRIVIERSRA